MNGTRQTYRQDRRPGELGRLILDRRPKRRGMVRTFLGYGNLGNMRWYDPTIVPNTTFWRLGEIIIDHGLGYQWLEINFAQNFVKYVPDGFNAEPHDAGADRLYVPHIYGPFPPYARTG